MYPNHFLTALSMAGLDKVLTPKVSGSSRLGGSA